MKKLFSGIAVCGMALALIIAGCKGSDSGVSNDPKAVLAAFFDKLNKKDIEGASKLATKESQPMMQMMKKGMDMAEKYKNMPGSQMPQKEDPSEKFKDITLGDARISGDNALVPFQDKTKATTFDFPLKKEDGSWKVDFSLATMMKMGINAAQNGMNNNNMNNNGSMNNGNFSDTSVLNKLNSLPSMDSMRSAIQKADSVLKNVDLNKLKNLFNNH
jgi:hypothetical protein